MVVKAGCYLRAELLPIQEWKSRVALGVSLEGQAGCCLSLGVRWSREAGSQEAEGEEEQ